MVEKRSYIFNWQMGRLLFTPLLSSSWSSCILSDYRPQKSRNRITYRIFQVQESDRWRSPRSWRPPPAASPSPGSLPRLPPRCSQRWRRRCWTPARRRFQSAKGPKYCFWGADCQSNMPLRAGGDCKWLVGMGTMTNEIPGGKSTQQRSGRVVLQLTISFRMLSMPSKYLFLVSPSYNLYLAFQKSGILVLLNKGVLHKNF